MLSVSSRDAFSPADQAEILPIGQEVSPRPESGQSRREEEISGGDGGEDYVWSLRVKFKMEARKDTATLAVVSGGQQVFRGDGFLREWCS